MVSEVAPNGIQVFNDYATPAGSFASRRAVVHYVVLGVSAPPLNDDDADGVPDYVERIGDAADTAIAYYERRGFAAILADAGGPDARPDLYVSRFAAGYFGVAFPAADAESGAFWPCRTRSTRARRRASAASTAPSPTSSSTSRSSRTSRRTAIPPLAGWVLEGTAAAMEGRVYPDLEDIVSSLQLRHWFAAPQRSVTEQSYGAQLLWRFLDERQPRLLPAYLTARVRAPAQAGGSLASTYERVAHRPFAPAFDALPPGRPSGTATGSSSCRGSAPAATQAGRVAPLGDPLSPALPLGAVGHVRFRRSRGEAALTYAGRQRRPGEPAAMHRCAPGRGRRGE